ncbi:MAG: alpha-L-fucosidase [Chthonomonadales bacterium]|nr:alpha-L-fucosidase [Chthonomonadales bacterium]
MTPYVCLLVLALAIAASSACAVREDDGELPVIAPGPFAPTYDSLKQYRCPDWFRDAKLGIWAHWGPQAVPMAGDWYARNMYIQGHRQYEHHLKHYGHPAEQGYKDIIPLWKAEKWDPDRLMALYKKAGARYFVSMGCHHDNFDLWNSQHNPWNAVKMGPKRDVVGEWQKAARKHGLKFGVSEHLGASFTWFQTSHGSDKEGPLAGRPYDGADPQWASLYHRAAEPGDTGWYTVDPRWHRTWFDRIRDLVDHYKPDLLYTDGGVPFGNDWGRAMIAHFYNADPHRVGVRPQVVYNCKQQSDGRWVDDLERGVMPCILPYPWQTDTSIGDWYYNADWRYRDIGWTIHMLLDIVSKNGNLLLNVVQRPDGSLDPEVETLLEQMAVWMEANGEGIYGTRPWITFGEGSTRARGGHFAEDYAYTSSDIRFTWKRGVLYAFAMGRPENGTLMIRSLATTAGAGRVRNVSVLGYRGKIEWRQDAEGLQVTLPSAPLSDVAIGLKITGSRLRDFTPPEPQATIVEAQPDGSFTLKIEDAALHGPGIRPERRGDRDNLGFWDSAGDWVSWKLRVTQVGPYEVRFMCATPHSGAALSVELSGAKKTVAVPASGSWDEYRSIVVGPFQVKKAGEITLAFRPGDPMTWKAINLADVSVVAKQ